MEKNNLFLVNKSVEYFYNSGNGRVLYNHFLNWGDRNLEISDDSSVHHLVREMVILKIIERYDADYIYYSTSIVNDIIRCGGYSEYLRSLERISEKERIKFNYDLRNAKFSLRISLIAILISIISIVITIIF